MTILRPDLNGMRVADSLDGCVWLVLDGVRHKIVSHSINDALFKSPEPIGFLPDIHSIKAGSDLVGDALLVQSRGPEGIYLRLCSSTGNDTYYPLPVRRSLAAYGFDLAAIQEDRRESFEEPEMHPISQDVSDPDDIGERGDGYSFSKGPSLLIVRTTSKFHETEFVRQFSASFADTTVLDLLIVGDTVRLQTSSESADTPSAFSIGHLPVPQATGVPNLQSVDRLNVLYAGKYAAAIVKFVERLKRPFDLTILDRLNIGEKEAADLEALAQRADRIIASAERIADDIASAISSLPPIIADLPEAYNPRKFRAHPARLLEGEGFRVLVMGVGDDQAARAKVGEAITALKVSQDQFCFYEVNQTPDEPLATRGQRSPLVQLGAMQGTNLNTIVCSLRPHLAWFPSSSADPLAFSLLQAMAQGIPILADDNDPYHMRLAGRAYTWLSPANASPAELCKMLLAIKVSRLTNKSAVQSEVAVDLRNPAFYSKGYVHFVLASQ